MEDNPIQPAIDYSNELDKKWGNCSCGDKVSFGCHLKCRICYSKTEFESHTIEYHLKAAGVPSKTARKTSELHRNETIIKDSTRSTYLTDSFKQSVFFHGSPGSGKTTLSVAMMIHDMIQSFTTKENFHKGKTYLFVTAPQMIQDIKQTFKQSLEVEQEVLNRYKNVDFLILDDFGVEKTGDWAFSVLYLILTHRYEEDKQTIFTSNFSLEQIAEKNNDERITRRILDWCRIIELK